MAKIFEKEVQKQLMTFLIENNFISIDQSAYRKFHNTQTSLHHVTDDWIDNMCDNLYTGICFLDIKKCFDTIDHNVLIEKTSYYGIIEKEQSWFQSYLENRALVVKCNGKMSDESQVNIGVPQGSVHGPVLFMIYVNDLSQHIHIGTSNLYADDALICCTDSTISGLNKILQKCVDDVCIWYNGNKLGVNAAKSNAMILASPHLLKNCDENVSMILNGSDIEDCKHADYLGLTIDNNLTWDQHIDKICRSLSFKVSRLARAKRILPAYLLLKIYNSVIQPSFDYGITIWGNTTESNLAKVQHIQNYAARIVTRNFDYKNYRGIDLVHSLGWMNIKQRFEYFQCILMFKYIHGMSQH